MTTKIRRIVVALATTLALLALLATPTQASTHSATITGGTFIEQNGTWTFTHALGGALGAGCSSSMEVTADHSAGTINITGFTNISHFIFSGLHWVSVITRTASATGSASGGVIGATTAPTITVNLVVYAATGTASGSTSVDCTPRAATKTCTLRANNIAIAGSYTTNTTHGSMGSSTTYDISSTGGGLITNVVGQTCGAPFNVSAGGAATITAMTGHFTTE